MIRFIVNSPRLNLELFPAVLSLVLPSGSMVGAQLIRIFLDVDLGDRDLYIVFPETMSDAEILLASRAINRGDTVMTVNSYADDIRREITTLVEQTMLNIDRMADDAIADIQHNDFKEWAFSSATLYPKSESGTPQQLSVVITSE